jgi:predicted transcriptional regulator
MPAKLSAKQASLRLIERLGDDVSFEDIIYELYFLQKVERGLRDVEQGRTLSHEEVRKEFERWLS